MSIQRRRNQERSDAVTSEDPLPLKQAGPRVGMAPLTLRYRAVYLRQIPYYRVGRRLVFRPSDLEAFMQRCRVPSREESR
jgi:hypothetical protein